MAKPPTSPPTPPRQPVQGNVSNSPGRGDQNLPPQPPKRKTK